MVQARTIMMNAVPRLLLASPVHRLLSGRYLMLEFTGRTTGRTYATPVAYVQHQRRLLISTDSAWWRNVTNGRTVAVRLRGNRESGTGSRVAGPAAVAALRQLAAIPGYARAAGMARVNRVVPDDEIAQAAQRRVVLAIDLTVDPATTTDGVR